MNTAEKLRFLADRVEDGKEFNAFHTYVYKFIDSKLLVVNDLGEYQQSILTIDDLLSYNLKLKPQWSFTEDEKAILRNLPEKYKWVVRDNSSKTLYVYENKPEKENDEIWCPRFRATSLFMFNHLFQSIQWSDDEPCEFREYL